MNPYFSIIIPVYNGEKYLMQCINSCINQTFQNIEIIAIDDSSNDNSLSILKKMAHQDTRIQILQNKKNIGTLATRLIGGGGS